MQGKSLVVLKNLGKFSRISYREQEHINNNNSIKGLLFRGWLAKASQPIIFSFLADEINGVVRWLKVAYLSTPHFTTLFTWTEEILFRTCPIISSLLRHGSSLFSCVSYPQSESSIIEINSILVFFSLLSYDLLIIIYFTYTLIHLPSIEKTKL